MENQDFFINHDGIRLHAKLEFPEVTTDQFPLMIIVHGFTGHMEENHIIAAANVATELGMAALRVEMYGHGKSDGRFEDHNLLKWLDELLAVVDYAAALPFVTDLYLCGHSQGGLATILVGAMKRDVLKAIIPLAPAIVIRDGARTGSMLGCSFNPEDIPAQVEFPDGKVLGGNYLRVAQLLPVEEAIRKFKKPVLLVHADTDESVPVFYSKKAASLYENATLRIITNDDHCFNNKLDEMVAAMKDFLM